MPSGHAARHTVIWNGLNRVSIIAAAAPSAAAMSASSATPDLLVIG